MLKEHDQLVCDCRALVAQWKAVVAKLQHSANLDRQEGFAITAQATECGLAAIQGCANGLESVLPCDQEGKV